MKKILLWAAALAAMTTTAAFAETAKEAAKPSWNVNMTAIEACSCPMFCQCYFATKPAAHATAQSADGHSHGGSEHFCRANMAWKVNKGTYGKTKLDGAKFWVASDLGDDFTDGTMKWAVVTFDPSVTKEQREGITTAFGHLFPVKWEQPMQVAADAPIEWTHTGDKAVAKIDGGKGGEIVLNAGKVNRNKSEPTVIHNLKYWGAPRHTGFVLMPSELEAWRGTNAFEFKDSNGFMITVDIASKDVAMAGGGGH
jgi:hypothetical protein